MQRAPETSINEIGQTSIGDHIRTVDDLARGMDLDPENVANHALLREEVLQRDFEIALRIQSTYEPCPHEETSPVYSEDGFESAVCFKRHPCEQTRRYDSYQRNCAECHRPIPSTCLISILLPDSGVQYSDPGSEYYSLSERTSYLTLVLTETRVGYAVYRDQDEATRTRFGSFELRRFPAQMERKFDPALIRAQLDYVREPPYYVRVPCSFLALVELRRWTLDHYQVDTGTRAEHVCAHSLVAENRCETVKAYEAKDARVAGIEAGEREAWERMNLVSKLVQRGIDRVNRKVSDSVFAGLTG